MNKRKHASREDFMNLFGIKPSTQAINSNTRADLVKWNHLLQIKYSDHIRFSIKYESHGQWVSAYILWPKKNFQKSKQKTPAVIVSHYHGSSWMLGKNAMIDESNNQTEALGLDLVSRGYVVLVPDILGFGDRVELSEQDEDWRKGEVGFTTLLAAYNLNADNYARHVIQDTIRAIDVLASEEGVDKNRIALVGYSFGGHVSSKTAALDERVYATIAFSAVACISTKISLNRKIDPMENVYGLLKVGDTDDLLRLIAPRALLISNSHNDPYTPRPAQVYRAIKSDWEDKGAIDRIALLVNYKTRHNLSVKMKLDAFDWLNKLMFPING